MTMPAVTNEAVGYAAALLAASGDVMESGDAQEWAFADIVARAVPEERRVTVIRSLALVAAIFASEVAERRLMSTRELFAEFVADWSAEIKRGVATAGGDD